MAAIFLLLLIGALFFTQATIGGAVDRLKSFADPGNEPANAGPRGSAFAGVRGKTKRATFIKKLKSRLGSDYKWGGTKPKTGVDCSGYLYWAMNSFGPFPYRTAAEQIAHAKPMSVTRALRTTGAVVWHEGHIAACIGDGGSVIEAPGEQGGAGHTQISDGRGRFTRGGLFPELV